MIEQNERSWRDSRRAFIEIEKPKYDGAFRIHATGEFQEPSSWYFYIRNRGKIASPNYYVEQACVAVLPSEPKSIPCAYVRHLNRPLPPTEHDADKERVDVPWINGAGPTGSRLGRRGLGQRRHLYLRGIGRRTRRNLETTGCWIYTKRDEDGTVMPGGNHRGFLAYPWTSPSNTLNEQSARRSHRLARRPVGRARSRYPPLGVKFDVFAGFDSLTRLWGALGVRTRGGGLGARVAPKATNAGGGILRFGERRERRPEEHPLNHQLSTCTEAHYGRKRGVESLHRRYPLEYMGGKASRGGSGPPRRGSHWGAVTLPRALTVH